jgi:uncharacterized protein
MQRPRKVPLRKCVGCQEMFEKKSLIRIVLTPEGDIRFDDTGKLNGRGAYLCHNAECLKQARKRKSLERALKCTIDGTVYDALAAHLEQSGPPGGAK